MRQELIKLILPTALSLDCINSRITRDVNPTVLELRLRFRKIRRRMRVYLLKQLPSVHLGRLVYLVSCSGYRCILRLMPRSESKETSRRVNVLSNLSMKLRRPRMFYGYDPSVKICGHTFTGLISEYIEGLPLSQLENPMISDILLSLLSELNDLHSCQIYHRDIRPENVIVNSSFHGSLINFGFVCIEKDIRHLKGYAGRVAFSSPCYIRDSLRRVLSRKVLQHNDLFSVGVCIIKLVRGKTLVPDEEPKFLDDPWDYLKAYSRSIRKALNQPYFPFEKNTERNQILSHVMKLLIYQNYDNAFTQLNQEYPDQASFAGMILRYIQDRI